MKKIFLFTLVFCGIKIFGQTNLPSNFFMRTLPNGLQMLVIEDSSVPLATIEIVVKNGAYTEDSAFNGLSHMYEHMFFKANNEIPSQEEFLKRVNELGISFNGTTSDERVNYFITLGSDKLNEGLKFMNAAIRYPLFLEEEMKKEDPVVNGEFQRNESDPSFFLFDDMNRNMWGKNYYRKNAIGLHDVILSATPDKMKAIQAKYYYPNNAMLAVAGNVNHKEVFDMIDKIYGDWKASDFDPFQKWPVPEFNYIEQTKSYVTVNQNAQVPIFLTGYFGPDTRNDIPSTYAADVFSTLCGEASSRLQKDLVESGLAYNVSIQYGTAKYTGPIIISMMPNPQYIKEAWDKLWENINAFANADYYTDEQLETAKNLLVVSDTYQQERTSQYVHSVTFWWASASIDYYTGYNQNVQKVTREDITNYIKKYIAGYPHINGLLVSPAMQENMDLKSMGFEAKTN